MHISQYFLRGDVRGAIAHMRAHEEFRDVLPAYLAIFENCEYRTYGIPAPLNDILRLYQIYFRDTFYCGLPEAEAADKLLARLKKRLDLPDADEARLTERMQALYDALGEAGLLEQVKVRFYPAAEYPGYSYLKIYERSASREAMLERLKQDLGMERSVVLTTQEGCGDVVIRGGANQAVKRLGRLFEPYLWEQK